MDERGWFEILIEGRHEEYGCLQRFWLAGNHLGQAIHHAMQVSKELDIEEPMFVCAAEDIDPEDVPDDAEQLAGTDLYYAPECPCHPYVLDDDPLKFPVGIVPACEAGDSNPEDITAGYRLRHRDGVFEVELIVDHADLPRVFTTLLRSLPAADALQVMICDHWECRTASEVWLSDDWKSHDRILSYIMDHKADLLDNGHVDLGVYLRDQKCTFSLDDHKLIKFYADDHTYADAFCAELRQLKYHELEVFKSIDCEYYHYHYRPHDSRTRSVLSETLRQDGFRLVEALENTG